MSTKFLNVPADLVDGFVDYVEVANTYATKTASELNVHRAAQEKAAALRDPLVEHMLKLKLIEPGQKQAAAAMLGSHPETMQLLKSATDKIAALQAENAKLSRTKTAGDLGSGVDDPTTAEGQYNSITDSRVGHKTAELKESDRVLMKVIGKG